MKRFAVSLMASVGVCVDIYAQSANSAVGAPSVAFYVLLAVLAAAIVFLLVFYRPKETPRIEDNPKYLELQTGIGDQKAEIASLKTTEQNLKVQLGDMQSQLRVRDSEIGTLQKRLRVRP